MGHRKWVKARSWREFHADDMIAEHNVLYDAWRASEHRVMETLDENNRLDRELDEARKRIAEMESPIRVPFSDEQIERMARAFWDRYAPFDASSEDAIRAALAAGGLEPCVVPEYEPDGVALMPSDDEVEKLARAIWKSYENLYCRSGVHMVPFEENRAAWFTQARAAIAHLATRPEGLPTAEELAEIVHEVIMNPSLKSPVSPHIVEAILAALRPWLRDPVGFELDVTADEMSKEVNRLHAEGYGQSTITAKLLDLCRSRIRPVYECKECAARAGEMMRPQPVIECAMCAEWEKDCRALSAASRSIDARIAARAALEGE